MYTLYYKPGSCSMAVHVLLNELGQDVRLEPYKTPDGEINPELAKINPRQQVPVIQDGDFTLREGAAILTWLCDEHQSDLLPRSGKDRAEALQWLMFANATLHPAYGRAFILNGKEIDESVKKELLADAVTRIQNLWDEVEAQLEQREYICGKQITIADILLTVIANWSPNLPYTVHFGAHCKALFAKIIQRPAYQKALGSEEVEYKVAA